MILLDEATSALDTESEKLVQGGLSAAAASGDRITIAVAHRRSTVRDANSVFVFYAGKIVEAGTHAELVAEGGMPRYARLRNWTALLDFFPRASDIVVGTCQPRLW